MKTESITFTNDVSCPLCLSNSHNPIILKNFKRATDHYFQQDLVSLTGLKIENLPHFYKCNLCFGLFRNPIFVLPSPEEELRYGTHNNDLKDQKYIDYLSESISPFLPLIKVEQTGLDYGCGPTQGIETILKSKKKYNIESYDKYFYPNSKVLKQSHYDYVFCHEVIEHFIDFKQEISNLLSLLKPDGQLFIRTETYPDEIEFFEDWYYKNDSTHVFFLSQQTFEYLCETSNLKFFKISKNKFNLQKLKGTTNDL